MSKEREYIGKKAKDTTTGFTGEITAYVMYKSGNDRAMLEGMDNTGRPVEWWFDINRLEIL